MIFAATVTPTVEAPAAFPVKVIVPPLELETFELIVRPVIVPVVLPPELALNVMLPEDVSSVLPMVIFVDDVKLIEPLPEQLIAAEAFNVSVESATRVRLAEVLQVKPVAMTMVPAFPNGPPLLVEVLIVILVPPPNSCSREFASVVAGIVAVLAVDVHTPAVKLPPVGAAVPEMVISVGSKSSSPGFPFGAAPIAVPRNSR